MGTGEHMGIDSVHCRAICDEIGDRLRIVLDREITELPARLQVLLLRLAAQDLARPPSIIGSIDELASYRSAEKVSGPILAA